MFTHSQQKNKEILDLTQSNYQERKNTIFLMVVEVKASDCFAYKIT